MFNRLVWEEVSLFLGDDVTLNKFTPDGGVLLDIFLSSKGNNSNHSQAAVVELPGLHEVKLVLIFGAETQGIETEVTRDIRVLDLVDVLGVIVPTRDTESFTNTNSDEEDLPELREDSLNSLETAERGNSTDTVEKGMPFLSDHPTESGKHSNTSVGQLSLAVTLGLGDSKGGGVSELDGIEEAQGSRDSGEGKHVVLATGALGGSGLASSSNNLAGGLGSNLGVSAKGAHSAHGSSRCHLRECVEQAKLVSK